MDCYEHHLQVNDNTLNLQKGGTAPSKYQKAGQAAIRRMLETKLINVKIILDKTIKMNNDIIYFETVSFGKTFDSLFSVI